MSQDSVQTQLKIFLFMLDADKPLRMTEISDGTGYSTPLLCYHIPKMIKNGLLVPVDLEGNIPGQMEKFYTIQMVFLNDALIEKLTKAFLPVVKIVGSNLVYEHTENGREGVIFNNLVAFLATISRKAK